MLSRIEKQLKRRFAIGSQVSEHSIIQDFTKQVGLPWDWVGEGEEGTGVLLVASHSPAPTHPALVSPCSVDGLDLTPGLFCHFSLGPASVWQWSFSCPLGGRGQVAGVLVEPYPGFPQPFLSIPSPHCLAFVGWGGAEPGG